MEIISRVFPDFPEKNYINSNPSGGLIELYHFMSENLVFGSD